MEQTWPQLLACACREGARVLWGDETAVQGEANWVRGFAPRGKTPVLRRPTRRDRLSVISAISARGQLSFNIIEGAINPERFIEFPERLVQEARQKIFPVAGNLRVHHAKRVSARLSDKGDRIERVFLPPYTSESRP